MLQLCDLEKHFQILFFFFLWRPGIWIDQKALLMFDQTVPGKNSPGKKTLPNEDIRCLQIKRLNYFSILKAFLVLEVTQILV